MSNFYRVVYTGTDELLEDEEDSNFLTTLSLCCRKTFSIKTLKGRVPIISWLPHYSLADLKGDAIAGLTVALTVIPQGLALAQLAGLPPQYGLYTAFMGCFMYTIFGSCKDLTIGPTAIMSLMIADYTDIGGVTYVILVTFLSGCVQLLMGILHLGFLINFISAPVISGFTSAAAITIATSQLMGLCGVKGNSNEFIETLEQFFSHIGQANYWDAIMGIICLVVLLLLKHFKDLKFKEDSTVNFKVRMVLEKAWWLLTTGKNAIAVLICGGLAAILLSQNLSPFTLTSEIKAGLPPFAPPVFSADIFDEAKNKTEHKNFIGMVEDIGAGLIVIPLLSILEAIAIAKAFAKGKKLDATQEMTALGICNIMGSFVSAYPATGSFSRTAINHSSGVRTPLNGVFTGSTVILALCVLSPYFQFIPKPSLSAIIIVAVLGMVHYNDVPVMWKTNKLDLIPLTATFVCSFLLGLEVPQMSLLAMLPIVMALFNILAGNNINNTSIMEADLKDTYGIIIGVVLSLLILMIQEARPNIVMKERKTLTGHEYLYVKPDRTVRFPSTELLVSRITKTLPGNIKDLGWYAVVIDGEHIVSADYTLAMGMKNMIDSFSKENILIIFININSEVIRSINGAQPNNFRHCTLEEEIEPIILEHAQVSGLNNSANNECSTSEHIKAEDTEHPLVDRTDNSIESSSKHNGNAQCAENGQLNEVVTDSKHDRIL